MAGGHAGGDFVGWLLARGKAGGAVAMLLGGVLLSVTVIDFLMTGGFFAVLPGVGAMLLLLGAALFFLDNPAARGEFKEPEERPLDDAVRAKLEAATKPFLLCMRCKKTTPFSPCMHCDRAIDVTKIDTDEDLKLAIAGME